MSEIVNNNSELLFIYDAKKSNPNGDMDDDNKPRMDKSNKVNLVSDVRLKRYIRDYFEFFTNKDVFITSNAKDSKDRGRQLKSKNKQISDCIDTKLFGYVAAQDKTNEHKTGPVQFTWGESLNKVELQKSKTITSSFSGGEGIGSDYRVVYSLISFSGSINKLNAKHASLSNEDVFEFNKALLNAIPLFRTRSKIGQTPRLYLKVDLKENYFLKDLRGYLKLDKSENLIDISDVNLDIKGLISYLILNKNKIEKINFWKDDCLKINGFSDVAVFKEKLMSIGCDVEEINCD